MLLSEWGTWGNWSPCSLTCGNGTMDRKRSCVDPGTGEKVAVENCKEGNSGKTGICNTEKCPGKCSSRFRP